MKVIHHFILLTYEGHLDIVNILIENGAYINTFKLGDEKKFKIVSMACLWGYRTK